MSSQLWSGIILKIQKRETVLIIFLFDCCCILGNASRPWRLEVLILILF